MDALAGTPLVRWQAPGGAFYFLIEVAQTYGRKLDGRTIRHGEDLSDILIDRGVAMVPGSGFGAPECIRLSFAASDENLRRHGDPQHGDGRDRPGLTGRSTGRK